MNDRFSEKQKEAIAYFKANEAEWLKNPLYRDKYIIIHDNQLVGLYDHFDTAFIEADGKYQQGNYIIQHLVDPKQIVHFYSPALN